MKFWQTISVTKLVFLIVMICLCVFTGYQYYMGQEITIKLWETVVTAIVSFYFGQKVGESQADPLLKEEGTEVKEPAIGFNLQPNEEEEGTND